MERVIRGRIAAATQAAFQVGRTRPWAKPQTMVDRGVGCMVVDGRLLGLSANATP
jgi:hypothetical protein